MSIKHTTRVIFKGIWRDMKTYARYRANFMGLVLEMITAIAGYALMASAYFFNPAIFVFAGMSESDFFIFMMTGALIQVSSSAATWAPLWRIQADIHYGTIEAIFVTPSSRFGYLLSTTISRSMFNFIIYFPYFLLILGLAGAFTNPLVIFYTFLMVLLTILTNISVGMFFGMLALVRRRTSLVVRITHQLIQYLFGAYLPIQGFMIVGNGFGSAMKYIALAFPFTYNFDLIRFFTMSDRYIPLLPIWQEFLFLGILIVFYFIIAKVLLIFAERKAKENGLAIL